MWEGQIERNATIEKKRGVCVWVGSLEKKKIEENQENIVLVIKASRNNSFLIFFIRRLMWVQNILSDFFSLLSTFIFYFYFGHAWAEKVFHLFLLIFLFHYHFFFIFFAFFRHLDQRPLAAILFLLLLSFSVYSN